MFEILLEQIEATKIADRILETYKRVETDESFTTGSDGISTPVATLADEYGGRAQIGVDDHCYVLYLLQEDGSYKHTAWIFPEAHEVLKDLPVPKYPLAEKLSFIEQYLIDTLAEIGKKGKIELQSYLEDEKGLSVGKAGFVVNAYKNEGMDRYIKVTGDGMVEPIQLELIKTTGGGI